MINIHKEKQKKQLRAQTEVETMRRSKQQQANQSTRQSSRIKAKMRVDEWIMEHSDSKIIKSLYHGNQLGCHPNFYDFRETDKKKIIHDQDIYVKKFLSSKRRAEENERVNKENILEQDLYKDEDTEEYFKNHYLRLRKENMEGPPMRYGIRTENERLKQKQKENESIDNSRAEVKMVHDPKWKEKQRWKWVGGEHQDLKTTFNSRHTWQQTPLRPQQHLYDYKEGLGKLGDDSIQRTRDKGKELNRREFMGVVQQDVWGTTQQHSQSLRTQHMDNIWGAGPRDQQQQLQSCYKQALLHSLHQQPPFIHSHNHLHLKLSHTRPTHPKIYNITVKHNIVAANLNRTSQHSHNNTHKIKNLNDDPLCQTNETHPDEEQSQVDIKPVQTYHLQGKSSHLKQSKNNLLTKQQKISQTVQNYFEY